SLLDRIEELRHVHIVEVVIFPARHFVVGMVRLPLAVEGPQHVVGIEVAGRLEVLQRMELDALAQVEGDRLAAIGYVPALRKTWNDFGRAALEFGEAIIDRARRVESGP